jgi:hypothetical protein
VPRRPIPILFQSLKRTDKTRQRDLRGLRDAKMLWIDSKERLMPGFIKPDSELQLGA